MQQLHHRYRVSSLRYLPGSDLPCVLTAPVIYGMVFPLAFMDAGLTLFQHIWFRANGVPRLRRRDHLVNNRHKLGYLNMIEKLNCSYCGYANGMVAYAHSRYPGFFACGDAASCPLGLADKRRALEHEKTGTAGRG